MALQQMLCVFFLFLTLMISHSQPARFGSKAKTLFFPPGSNEQDECFTRIRRNVDTTLNKDVMESRHKRQTGNGINDNTETSDDVSVTKFDLNDPHPELLVHWVGASEDEIICLTRDITITNTSDSNVYISYDYGRSFEKKDWHNGDERPVFEKFYHSSANLQRYIFNDVVHRTIWVTTDVGRSIAHYHVPFRPTTISMHDTMDDIVLAMDNSDEEKQLWLSENFGATWRVVQRDVKSFYWGIPPYDKAEVLYVEREEPSGLASVLRSEIFFEDFRYTIVVTGVKDFEVREDYLFATKPRVTVGETDILDLWVSHERGPFRRAELPTEVVTKGFYIADASEEQVFVCIHNGEYDTNLYISEAGGYKFTLSLENVVYYSPEGPGKDSWLSQYADEPFADVYKVEGLRGIYIASQFLQKTLDFSESNMVSVITYDKGGEWSSITKPETDHQGHPYACSNCSLHLSQKVSRYRPGYRTVPIVSRDSAPGLILGTGKVGTSTSTEYSIFLSSTAGASWNQVLEGNYFYTFAEHGGIVAAVQQYGSINEIKFSLTEGESWRTEVFTSPNKIMVYGLMTEPGETSTIITVFGSEVGEHSWLVVQIDFQGALGPECIDDQYKTWWPGEGFANINCLLGRKSVYERREINSICYNGRDYDRPITNENCPCTREDFECDEGYMELGNGEMCVKDTHDQTDPGQMPLICPEGETYRRSKGYRKVEGDTCAGYDAFFAAEYVACPIGSNPEFLLYSQRTEIHRYLLASLEDEELPMHNLKLIAAVDYDVGNNCYYYADTVDDQIRRYCPDGSGNEETVLIENDIEMVEGLAFDWLALNIYWLDSAKLKIEVARHDGRLRRMIVDMHDSPNDQPRALALDPSEGYMFWADWGNNPRIIRAYMDGTNQENIITNNIHWPNGITIDEQTGRIYWTDAYFYRIESSYSDGSGRLVIISERLPHPFAIAVYKDRIYWDDWTNVNIESANKHDGSDRREELRGLDGVMDLKIFHNSSQQGNNPCSRLGGCSQLCLVRPNVSNSQYPLTRRCLCAQEFEKSLNTDGSERCLCPGNLTPSANGTCPAEGSTCQSDQFHCAESDYCITDLWRCDHDNDCPDGSDERDCPYLQDCRENQFACATEAKCIPLVWLCDHDEDCADASDELGCLYPTCSTSEFACRTGRCIPDRWRCDFDNDCGDFSDEEDCHRWETTTPALVDLTCSGTQFTCDNGRCIYKSWKCDGDNDCGDMSDELLSECSTSVPSCQTYQFHCNNGNCIPSWWRCDNYDDCQDNSDEGDCSTHSWEWETSALPTWYENCTGFFNFHCLEGTCVPASWKCDQVDDCPDGSDEYDCDLFTDNPSSCPSWNFQCDNGHCIASSWECDNYDDCGDNSDERNCETFSSTTPSIGTGCSYFKEPCGPGETPSCIWSWWFCDQENDCSGGSDERNCGSLTTSASATVTPPVQTVRPTCYAFMCVSNQRCISLNRVCNRYYDCIDGSDEMNCHEPTTVATTLAPCPANHFQCFNAWHSQQCIDDLLVCNGVRDCGDSLDEQQHCHDNYTVTQFTATNVPGGVRLLWHINDIPSSSFSFKLYARDLSVTHLPAAQIQIVSSSSYFYDWNGLQQGDLFEFTIAVVVGQTVFQKAPLVQCVANVRVLPTAPTNVVLSSYIVNPNVYGVSVVWDASSGGSYIMRYEIDYQIQDSIDGEGIVTVPATVHEKTFEALLQHVNYVFKVRAVNDAGHGPFSPEKFVYVGLSSVPTAPRDVVSLNVRETTVYLTWQPGTGNVNGYIVYYTRQGLFGDTMLANITGHYYTASNLCPGTRYSFTVAAYNRYGVGHKAEPYCDVLTAGLSVSAPTDFVAEVKSTSSVRLSWTPVHGQSRYNIYYSVSTENLQSVRNITDTSFTVEHLLSAVTYYFWVQVDLTNCDTPKAQAQARTIYDDGLPPRNLNATSSKINATMFGEAMINLTWRSPRDTPELLAYNITYIEHGTSELQHHVTKLTNSTRPSYQLVKLIPGAKYDITVATMITKTTKNPQPSHKITTRAASYRPPATFNVVKDKSTVNLIWTPSPDKIAERLGFIIFELNGSQYSSDEFTRILANDSNWICSSNVTYQELNFVTKNISDYTRLGLSVSVGYYRGYHGTLSNKERIEQDQVKVPDNPGKHTAPDKPTVPGKPANIWFIISIASVGVLVILLATALMYFVVRHQRLQRSFMSFANSHYDTRSGTATFSGDDNATELDEEEEDQPIIRGFSDDEPLVVA